MLSYLNTITPPPSPEDMKVLPSSYSGQMLLPQLTPTGSKRSRVAVPQSSQNKAPRMSREGHVMGYDAGTLDAMKMGVDVAAYTYQGTFIPAVLLALAACPRVASPRVASPRVASPQTSESTPQSHDVTELSSSIPSPALSSFIPSPTLSSSIPSPALSSSTPSPVLSSSIPSPALSNSTPSPVLSPPAKPTTITRTTPFRPNILRPPRGYSATPAKHLPFTCRFCGKGFSNIGNLVTHSRTHTKEKPFKCEKCGLDFAHTSNLQRHQLVHTGIKSNKCGYCGKCFSRSDYLKVHERTHTGEKPYRCGMCNKRFLDSSSLKKHSKTHEPGPRKAHRSSRVTAACDAVPRAGSEAKKAPALSPLPSHQAVMTNFKVELKEEDKENTTPSLLLRHDKITPARPVPVRLRAPLSVLLPQSSPNTFHHHHITPSQSLPFTPLSYRPSGSFTSAFDRITSS